jgi:large subunit ribosomal protein L46
MHFSFVTMLTTTKVIKAVSTVTSRSLRSVQSTGAASLFHTQAVRRGLSPQSVEEYIDPHRTPTRIRKAQLVSLINEWNNKNNTAKQSGFARDWVVKAAAIVERSEIIAPEDPEWLVKYKQWREKWEAPIKKQMPDIKTLLEDEDKKTSGVVASGEKKDKKKKKEKKGAAEAEDEEAKAKRERESRAEELRKANETQSAELYGPRITEADKANDRKSLYRKLDKKLFLIVKRQRDQHTWQFPQGDWVKGEVIRESGQRQFVEKFSSDLDVYFAGNCPQGVYGYEFPRDVQKKLNAYGAKVFFLYGYYVKGSIKIMDDNIVDYLWVTKEELAEYLDPETYKFAAQMLPDTFIDHSVQKIHYLI